MSGNVRALPGLNLVLMADVGRFSSGMNEAAEVTEKTVERIKGKFEKLTGVFEGVIATFAFEKIVEEAGNAEKAFAQLEAGVRSTGGAAGYTADALREMSETLKKHSTFSAEAIQNAEGLLLTFTKIGHEALPQAAQAVLDVATKLHKDLGSAALLVGKALEDPVKGLSGLRKAGVEFSAGQKELIKSMVEAGDMAGAQQKIFKRLEIGMGGAAEAARNTLGGSVDALKISFDDLLKSIGLSQSSGLQAAFAGLTNLFDQGAAHAQLIGNAIEGIAAAAVVLTAAKLPATIAAIAQMVQAAGIAVGTFEAEVTLGLSLVVAAMVALRDVQFNLAGHTVSEWGLMRAAWDEALKFGKFVMDGLSNAWKAGSVLMDFAWQVMSNNVKNYIDGMIQHFKPLIDLIVKLSDMPMFNGLKQQAATVASMFNIVGKSIGVGIATANSTAKIGIDKFLSDAEKYTTESKKHAENGDLPKVDLSDTPGTDKAAKKHKDSFDTYIKEQQATTAGYMEELNGQKDILNVAKDRAALEAKIGTLVGKEVDLFNATLRAQRDAKEATMLKANAMQMQEAHQYAQAELEGHKEDVPVMQLMNKLRNEGIRMETASAENQQRIRDLIKQTAQAQKDLNDLAVQKANDGMDLDIAHRQDVLRLGKEQAAIEDNLRRFAEAHPLVTQAELDSMRERLGLIRDTEKAQQMQDFFKGENDKTKDLAEQLRQRVLLDGHLEQEALYEKQIYEYEKQTKLEASDHVKEMIRQNVAQQQQLADANKALDIIKSQRTIWEKYHDDVASINDLFAKGLITQQQWLKATTNLNPAFQQMKDAAKQIGDSFSNAFDAALFSGKKFGDVLKDLSKQLAEIILKKAVFEPLGNAISAGITKFTAPLFAPANQSNPGLGPLGGFGGGSGGGGSSGAGNSPGGSAGSSVLNGLGTLLHKLHIPFFADGGDPLSGQPAWVGEMGPELFVPDRPGTIIPNGLMGSLFNDAPSMAMLSLFQMLYGGGGMGGGQQAAPEPSFGGYGASESGGGPSSTNPYLRIAAIGRKRSQAHYAQNSKLNYGNMGGSASFGYQALADDFGVNQNIGWAGQAEGTGPQVYQTEGTWNQMETGVGDIPTLDVHSLGFSDGGSEMMDAAGNFGDGSRGMGYRGAGQQPEMYGPLASNSTPWNGGMPWKGPLVQDWNGGGKDTPSPYEDPHPQSTSGANWGLIYKRQQTAWNNSDILDHAGAVTDQMDPWAKYYKPQTFDFSNDSDVFDGQIRLQQLRDQAKDWNSDPDVIAGRRRLAQLRGGSPWSLTAPFNDPHSVMQANGGLANSGFHFADGGDPPIGMASLVGERGPELFVPKTAGTVVPHELLGGGGGGNMNVEVHNHTGQKVTQEETQGPDGKQLRIMIGDMITQSLKAGPGAAVLRDTYGVRQKGVGR